MKSFKGKRVLIFGLGLNQGGVGSALFFAKQGAEIRITDLKTTADLQPSLEQLNGYDISYTLGKHRNTDIDWADIIIRNPAIKDNNEYLKYALEKGKGIETDFSIFLDFADQKKLIAVTGTKGKSTTSSLIYQAIKESGKKVVFAGNIGKSILDTIPYLAEDPWIVIEISSFQLQALKGKKFAPKIAVITNIYPDHLNWHVSMEDYIQAKKMVALGQTDEDFLIVPCSGSNCFSKEFLQGIKSILVDFCTACDEHLPAASLRLQGRSDSRSSGVSLKGQVLSPVHPRNKLRGILRQNKDIGKLLEKNKLPLVGNANKENYAAALSVCDILGIDRKTVIKAFKKFKGGEFRMQLLGTFKGISIFNDSTATNPIATLAALQTLGGSNVILITGGMNKGMEYEKLADVINNDVKKVFFLEGDAADSILSSLRAKNSNLSIYGPYNNLEELLTDVKKEAKPGDVVLFSPAATSFNLFQNEFDRGRKFNDAVAKIFK